MTAIVPPPDYRGRLVALSLAMLLPSLGTSIANVALPSLAAAFLASSQEVQWVVIAYLLAVTALLVTAGRLGDLFGRRRLLLAGIGTFAVAAAAAAFAADLLMLIFLRAVQGMGAAVMMSLTVAAVGDMVPRERTGSAMGLLGAVSAVGTALGPSLGGVLVASFGWPALFLFMGAAGGLAFVLGYRLLPADAAPGARHVPFDVSGTLLLIFSLTAFALATTIEPPTWRNVILAAAAAVGGMVFLVVEAAAAGPLVRLELLKDRTIGAGLISNALVSAILMTTLVVGPFYLSGMLALGPAATGLVMSVGPAVAALAGVPAGRLVDRFGAPATSCAGLGAVLLGSLLMALLPAALGVGGYVGSLVPITAGYALFQAANNTAIMSAAGKDQRGVTSALLNLARNLGLITGASAMGAVFAYGSKRPGFFSQADGEAGLQLTFLVAAALASLALLVAWQGFRPARL
jgi:MFS family permease